MLRFLKGVTPTKSFSEFLLGGKDPFGGTACINPSSCLAPSSRKSSKIESYQKLRGTISPLRFCFGNFIQLWFLSLVSGELFPNAQFPDGGRVE